MRRPLLASLTAAAALAYVGFATAQTATWTIDSNHSTAQFSVKHLMISTVRGAFNKVSGTIQYDGKDVRSVAADVTIDATTIDTRVDRRDEHLRSADFFDVTKYPTITFKSKRAEPGSAAGTFKLVGDLTMHGVTKEITLDVEGPAPAQKDAKGILHSGATATANIKRSDWGLTWNRALEAGGVTVSDEVQLVIDVEFTRPAGT
jgi:polyisoprenoid-binding protein YceI